MTDVYPVGLASRGGICLCGSLGISLIFGGSKPAHFTCDRCQRRYDLNGVLIDD